MGVDFEDAVLRLERAKKQIDSFEDEVAAFLNTNPSGCAVKQNPKTGVFTLSLVVNADPPGEWRVVLQEIVANMRTPFDYVMVALADANGGHDNRTAFPIFGKRRLYLKHIAERKPFFHIPEAAQDLVESVQPYHRGDYKRLDVLRRLDDDGKHKRLHATTSGAVYHGFGIREASPIVKLEVIRSYPRALKHGDPLVSFRLDGYMQIRPDFTPEVVLGQRTAAKGRPLIGTLREIHETTTVVIDQFVQTFS